MTQKETSFDAAGTEFYITEPGREPVTIDDLLNGAINSVRDEVPLNAAPAKREMRFPEGTVLSVAGYEETGLINGIRFKVRILASQLETSVDGTHVIEYIVKELFQGRRFTIGTNGQVNETTDI